MKTEQWVEPNSRSAPGAVLLFIRTAFSIEDPPSGSALNRAGSRDPPAIDEFTIAN